MIEHAGVAKARGFLDAFARGDAQAMGDYFTGDLAWHVGGGHRWSGDHRGREELVSYLCQLREGADDTYTLTAESVLATDHHIGLFARATAQREGRALDVLQAHAFTVRSDGMWGEYWVSAAEQGLEDAFWS